MALRLQTCSSERFLPLVEMTDKKAKISPAGRNDRQKSEDFSRWSK
jgi:hypothetical protein